MTMIGVRARRRRDVTIRQGLERVSMDDEYEYQEDPEPWAVDVRRSVERTRTPAKGILKCKLDSPPQILPLTFFDRSQMQPLMINKRISLSRRYRTGYGQTHTIHLRKRSWARWLGYLRLTLIILMAFIDIHRTHLRMDNCRQLPYFRL